MILHILKGKNLSEVFMKDTKLTVTIHMGGKQIDKLTPEQKERMAKRLSEVMSLYFANHPEECSKIKN